MNTDIKVLVDYVKGMLEGEEHRMVEEAIANDPILQEVVKGIKIDLEGNEDEPVLLEKHIEDTTDSFGRFIVGLNRSTESFVTWIRNSFSRKEGWGLGIWPILMSTVIAIILTIIVASGVTKEDSLFIQLPFLQFIIILLMFLYLTFNPAPKGFKRLPRQSLVLKHIYRWYTGAFGGWLFLYGLITLFDWLIIINSGNKHIEGPLLNLANNFVSLFFYFCYVILIDKTLNEPEAEEPSGEESVILRSELEVQFKKDQMHGFSHQNFFKKYWHFFTIILLVSIAEYFLNIYYGGNSPYSGRVTFIFGLISGGFATLSLGLFFSRISSMYLDVPKWVLGILFIYIGIQLFWGSLSPSIKEFLNYYLGIKAKSGDLATLFMSIALIGKVTLFLVMQWLFKTNRLIYYIFAASELSKKVRKARMLSLGVFLKEESNHETIKLLTFKEKKRNE